MKTKIILPLLAFIMLGINLSSCKKTDNAESNDAEIATTTDLASRQAISDNLVEDANDVFMNSASDDVLGNRPTGTNGVLGCGTATVTPTDGFPKTVVVDFGTSGCTSTNGVTRSGKITIVVSDSVRKSGSTAVMTFDNYIVNGFKIEGTLTWTNTSASGIRSWKREMVNGKTTNTLTGNYWLHSGVKYVKQLEGRTTPHYFADDVFEIKGSHTVTNALGRTRTCTINDAAPLIKHGDCHYISQGNMKLQGPKHYAVIDFGSGTCDDDATISIDGGTPTGFKLH